jgi:hypothetical protein
MPKILHKRSSGTTQPTATVLTYGEIAMNYRDGYESLFFRNTNDEIVAIKPLEYNDNRYFKQSEVSNLATLSGLSLTVGAQSRAENDSQPDPFLKIQHPNANGADQVMSSIRISGGTNVTVLSKVVNEKGIIAISSTDTNTHDQHFIRLGTTVSQTANTNTTGTSSSNRLYLNLVTQNNDISATTNVTSSVAVSGGTFISIGSQSGGVLTIDAKTGYTSGTLAEGSHTHNYAGSDVAGGTAYKAKSLDLPDGAIGNSYTPVYLNAQGNPIACSFSVATNVPENAIFTDEQVLVQPITANTDYTLVGVAPINGNGNVTTTLHRATGVTFTTSGLKVNNTNVSLEGHKHIWGDITGGTPNTLSGYGITDAYTKTEINNGFLPLSGGTMAGGINMNTGNTIYFGVQTEGTVLTKDKIDIKSTDHSASLNNNSLTFDNGIAGVKYEAYSDSYSALIVKNENGPVALNSTGTTNIYGTESVSINTDGNTAIKGTTAITLLSENLIRIGAKATTTVSGSAVDLLGTTISLKGNGSNAEANPSFTMTATGTRGLASLTTHNMSVMSDILNLKKYKATSGTINIESGITTNISGTTSATTVLNVSGRENHTGANYHNGYYYHTGDTRHNGNLFLTGSTYQTGSVNLTGSSYVYNGGYYNLSDERLKLFAEDVTVDFIRLKEIPKKYFTFKDDPEQVRHIGTSAQKVREVYPEVVGELDNILNVDYSKLSIVALKAVDRLYEQNLQLQQEIDELRQELKEIKKKLK